MNSSEDKQKLTFLGDLYLPEAYSCDFVLENYILNLEYAITNEKCGVPGKVNLKSSDCYIEETFGHKPMGVCIANNHVFDYGEKGFIDTIDRLTDKSISYFGAGKKAASYHNPLFVEINGVKVAVLAYVCESTSPSRLEDSEYGVAIIDSGRVGRDIQELKSAGVERVIVVFHWGAEHVHKAKYSDIVIARAAVDRGADLVIGHHAHCVQNHELYKGVYIFYGLGNCIFPDFSAPAFYDEDTCEPSRRFTYVQKYWNKNSISVEYEPKSNDVRAYRLKFDNKSLAKGRAISLEKKEIRLDETYHRIFKRAYTYGKLRRVLFNWLENPKLPTMKHFKSIKKVLGDQRYK